MDAEKLKLLADNKRLRLENAGLRARVAELEGQVKRLTGQVETLAAALEKSQRAGKRQAAPFRKQRRAGEPKKPGRKPGDAHGQHAHRSVPKEIDETHDAPLPKSCPYCGSSQLEETHVAEQFQTEIPRRPIVRQFDVHVGHCAACGGRVQGRHKRQTSDALGAAAAQLGADAHAALALCNKDLGLSHGKGAKLFRQLFGVTIARSTSVRSMLRTANQCQRAYEEIRQSVRGSPFVVPDETGWRVGGKIAWLHAFPAQAATCYVIDPSRSHRPATELLGENYAGVMIHDGWSPYDRFVEARHQQCVAHLLRRCGELLETATGPAVRFPRAVMSALKSALSTRDRQAAGKIGRHGLATACGRVTQRMRKLVTPVKTDAANERLAAFLERHLHELFTFLALPGVDATNWRGEQAIRPAVVNRKVWGDNRTWRGADAQAILMSVLRTCHQQHLDSLNYLSQTRRSPDNPPLLLPTR